MPYSSSVYSNGQPPMRPDNTLYQSIPVSGWWYKNLQTGVNISWGIGLTNTQTTPTTFNSNMLKQVYVCFVSALTTCSLNLGIYTLPATSPNYYKSRMSLVLQEPSVSITASMPYIAYYDLSGSTLPAPQKFCYQPLQMVLAQGTSSQVGNFYNEDLWYMSVGSNTIQPAGLDSFVVQEAGVVIDDGINPPYRQPFLFNGGDVPNTPPATIPSSVLISGSTIYMTPQFNNYTILVQTNFTVSSAANGSYLGLGNVQAGYFAINFYNTGASRVITYTGATGSTTYTIPTAGYFVLLWANATGTGVGTFWLP